MLSRRSLGWGAEGRGHVPCRAPSLRADGEGLSPGAVRARGAARSAGLAPFEPDRGASSPLHTGASAQTPFCQQKTEVSDNSAQIFYVKFFFQVKEDQHSLSFFFLLIPKL